MALRLGVLAMAAALLVAVAVVLGSPAAEEKRTNVAAAGGDVTQALRGVTQDGIALGAPDAPVTLVEFADLQCPFCRRYTADVLPDLVRDYVRPGRVKMVFRDLAFLGDDSVTAARAAAAAGMQDKLWQFVDAFYADQGEENSGYVTDDFIRRVAQRVPRLDVPKLMRDRNSPFTLQQIAQAKAEGRRLDVSSTPTFFLQRGNGPQKRLEFSDYTPAAFTGPIDSALAG
jgi:protein-disulfide isomerase